MNVSRVPSFVALGVAAVGASLLWASSALAQDSAPTSTPAEAMPRGERASEPQAARTDASTSDPTCAVERHDGFSAADAAGVEEAVCGLIRSTGRPGHHRIRVVKLGAKVVLTLSESVNGSAPSEKQIVLSDLGEVTVAAPRLIEANIEQKPVADTIDVTNVVGDEARTPKKRPSAVHGWMGVIGAGGSGRAGGGVNLGLSAGSERWSFVGDLRLAGEAFNKPAALTAAIFTLGSLKIDSDADFSYVSLSAGARHHLMSTEVSPFLGLGLGLNYIGYGNKQPPSSAYYYGSRSSMQGKTGLAAYTEVGLDLLRTRTFGGAVIFRVDLPAFAVDETKIDPTNSQVRLRRSTYSPVFSAGFALRF